MLFLDSGAHSLYKKHTMLLGKRNDFRFYETDEFWNYVNDYAEFIKENKDRIDIYVNVDVIFNPELTWKVQRYLEDFHKLHPLPVFHSNEDIKWFKKYLDKYDYIGVGGIGQTVGKTTWIRSVGDPVFSIVCDTPDRTPRVKLHGFAIASPELIAKYPWASVDTASWVIYGRYGGVIIPRKKNGKYDYTVPPWLIKTSWRNHHINIPGTHIDNVSDIQRKEFVRYFAEKGFVLGTSKYKKVSRDYELKENEQWIDRKKKDEVEIIIEKGVCNFHEIRDDLNLYYFLDTERNIPEYPWSWGIKTRRIFI